MYRIAQCGHWRTAFIRPFTSVTIGGVEAFGEPVVEIGEHPARLFAMTLLHEQSCQAGRRSQLKEFRGLFGGNRDRAPQVSLGLSGIFGTHQKGFALDALELGFPGKYTRTVSASD